MQLADDLSYSARARRRLAQLSSLDSAMDQPNPYRVPTAAEQFAGKHRHLVHLCSTNDRPVGPLREYSHCLRHRRLNFLTNHSTNGCSRLGLPKIAEEPSRSGDLTASLVTDFRADEAVGAMGTVNRSSTVRRLARSNAIRHACRDRVRRWLYRKSHEPAVVPA